VHQIANPLNLLDVFGGRTDYQFNKNNRLGAKSDRLLAQGFVGTMSGVGASLSTTVSGLLVASLGRAAGFLGIAAVALVAVLLMGLLMPETEPLNRDEHR